MKNVAIVAAAAGREQAPFTNPDWECWGLNATWDEFSEARCARWFELHRRRYLEWEWGGSGHHFRWLKALRRIPVYVQRKREWPDVPQAIQFPWKDLKKLVPAFANYHACSIDWMIALAIHLGAPEIGLFGVEQQHTAEPLSSRACVEFWSGVAVGRGIKVWSADGSTFKLAHLTYTKTPYALDPAWRPFEDRTGGAISRQQQQLLKTLSNGD